jgi:hypothetical protein
MLWGQPKKVFTDHTNLMRDALGSTFDQVYRWRLLLEEYEPEIVYIKGMHNTLADAISRLEDKPSVNQTPASYFMTKVNKNLKCSQRQNWMAVSKHWCKLKVDTNKHEDLNLMFANHGEEDEIYPLTTIETAKVQNKIESKRSIKSKM